MAINLEHTDTFAGDANYSWVRRAHVPVDGLSDRALVRRAKAWAGLTGRRCRVENHGDTIAIYPRGMATVLFIAYSETPTGPAI